MISPKWWIACDNSTLPLSRRGYKPRRHFLADWMQAEMKKSLISETLPMELRGRARRAGAEQAARGKNVDYQKLISTSAPIRGYDGQP
jgi:hypothetical protein